MPSDHQTSQTPRRSLRHLDLLAALVALLIVQSFLSPDHRWERAIVNLMFFGVTLAAIRTLSRSRIRLRLTLFLGVITYIVSWISEFTGSALPSIVTDVCYVAIFALLVVTVAEHVFSVGPVDANRIVGAVTIYFLLALGWAFLYSLLERFDPGSFRDVADSDSHLLQERFIYFSHVTLTTLGYGDIVPRSAPARTLATLQAMIGQLYLAIVVGRLIGLQISQGSNSEKDETSDPAS